MKVAFWDGIRSCDDVTGYIAAISTFCAIKYEKKVFLGSNHISSKTLKDYFFGSFIKSGGERILRYMFYGEPEYFRQLWERQTEKEFLTLEGIHVVPLPDLMERHMFYHNVRSKTLYFMDVSGGMNASVRLALEEADKVVVFLPQNIIEIRRFFDMYSSIIPKAIFLILNYREDRKGDPAFLCRKYGLHGKHVGIFPHCEDFSGACEMGSVERFVRENFQLTEEHENFDFMRCIARAARMILGYEEEKEEHELSE